MGREWLNWVGGSGGGGRFSGGRGKTTRKMKDAATSAGCMCAVFQLLHFQSPSNYDHHHPMTTTWKAGGVEAPRNSLELNEPPPAVDAPSPISSPRRIKYEEGETNFLVGIQIKTSCRATSKSKRDDECSIDSPAGTKTPSLVARLMGLDLLPECTSPSTSSGPRAKARLHPNLLRSINGARSLPETPRVSLARRSDAEYHTPRLSLQINKENISREFEFSEKLRPQPRDENESPGSSARHFVEHVKNRVSRRRGAALVDITNHRDYREQTRTRRRDGNLIPAKVKPTKIAQSGPKARVITPLQEQRISKKNGSGEKGKKNSTVKIKSKRTPLLIDPNLLKIKKNPSPPPTKLPPKQSQVSDALSSKRISQTHLYKRPQRKILALPDIPTGCAAALPGGAAAEYGNYIRKILKRAGIVNEANPFTSAKPIDPSIFHYLELFHPISGTTGGGGNAVLSHRCNRKLIFQLVNELVTEISRPRFNSNHWVSPISGRDGDSPLVDELCKKIGSFPAGNCPVEDIDSLVERELRELESKELFREEESVVCEIEGEIVESLLRETAAMAARVRRKKRAMPRGDILMANFMKRD